MGDLMFCGMNIFAQCVIISNVKVLILSYSPSVGLYLSVIAGIGFFYILSFVA